MSQLSRRTFVAGAAAAAAALTVPAMAEPFGLPLGLQLYSVRDQLPGDYEGTLEAVAGLGYREVEAAGFLKKTPAEVRAAMQGAGLRCVSAHYPATQLEAGLDAILAFHRELGTARYIVCAFPGRRNPANNGKGVDTFTLDDWKWNAARFNEWGAKVKAAGFHFAYHNHFMEFAAKDGVVPYDLLLRETDPATVAMEMDCGWVMVGGGSPEHYLRAYPDRIRMLHIKDFKRLGAQPPAAELGRGVVDYRPIFAAVKPGSIQHMFVEQEQFLDLPWKQALAVDAHYLKAMRA